MFATDTKSNHWINDAVSLHRFFIEYFDSSNINVESDKYVRIQQQTLELFDLSITKLCAFTSCTLSFPTTEQYCYIFLSVKGASHIICNGIKEKNGFIGFQPNVKACEITLEPDSCCYLIKCPISLFERQLMSLVKVSHLTASRFKPALLMSDTLVKFLQDSVQFLIHQSFANDALCLTSMHKEFEQMLIKGILYNHDHGYSQLLLDQQASNQPSFINKALAFIQQSIKEPISLDDIVLASEVNPKRLYAGFNKFIGMPPMQYLKVQRLEAVKAQLETQRSNSVTDVAIQWGFSHLGRFSADYKKHFQESPSATLAKTL
ncbi:helix-turn-helix domain-containing protein [Colwellia sp. MEBiC06753]